MSQLRNPTWGNEAVALRYKQIDSLRQYYPQVKEVNKDMFYDVTCVLPTRKAITIRVGLGKDFPYQAPSLQVFPQATHKYLNQQCFVLPQIHEKMSSWTVHTNLGKLVYEVVQKFMSEPPVVGAAPIGNEPPPPYSTSSPSPSPSPNPNSNGVARVPVPSIPSSFPELEDKTADELQELLNNETKFNELFDNLDVVKNMRQLKEELTKGNEELSKKNMSKCDELDKLRVLYEEKKTIVDQNRVVLEHKIARQQEVLQQFTSAALIERLGDAAQEADNESENIAMSFLDGTVEMDHKEFIKIFMERRKIYHLRAAKKESMAIKEGIPLQR